MSNDLLLWGSIGTGVVLLVACFLWLLVTNRKQRRELARNRTNLHGAVRMLDGRDIDERTISGDDFLNLGRLIDPENPTKRTKIVGDDTRGAACLYGEPGLGKTVFLVQAILRHRGPVFVSTTKDDLADTTLRARRNMGPAVVFDPADDECSAIDHVQNAVRVWTPITEAVNWQRTHVVAEAIARGASDTDRSSGGGKDNEFFYVHSVAVVAVLLVLMRATRGGTLDGIIDWTERLQGDGESDGLPEAWGELIDAIQQSESGMRDTVQMTRDPKKKAEAKMLAEALLLARRKIVGTRNACMDQRTRASIMGSVATITGKFTASSSVLMQPWETSLRLDMMPELHTVYLITPTEAADVRGLCMAFLVSYMGELRRRSRRQNGLDMQHLVVLDEAAYATPVAQLRSWAAEMSRSSNIRLLICTQCVSDLQIAYGEKGANSLQHACKTKITFGGDDPELLKAFSTIAGKRQLVERQSVSVATTKSNNYSGAVNVVRSSFSRSRSDTETRNLVERDLASQARISAMPMFEALVRIPAGRGKNAGVLQVEIDLWWEDSDMRAASEGDANALQRVQRAPDVAVWVNELAGEAANQQVLQDVLDEPTDWDKLDEAA